MSQGLYADLSIPSASHDVSESKASEWLLYGPGTREGERLQTGTQRKLLKVGTDPDETIEEPGAGGWRPGGTEKARTSQG